jgi:quercetin dioxygenase-like cupin family protein
MRLLTAAALAVVLWPALASAAPRASALTTGPVQPPAAAPASGSVRVAMRRETLPPGGALPEHRQDGDRYLFVVSGRLKVADLVTGDEQVVEAGKMAAEQPGDWHIAQALGGEPVVLYIIDRDPQPPAATAAAGHE